MLLIFVDVSLTIIKLQAFICIDCSVPFLVRSTAGLTSEMYLKCNPFPLIRSGKMALEESLLELPGNLFQRTQHIGIDFGKFGFSLKYLSFL